MALVYRSTLISILSVSFIAEKRKNVLKKNWITATYGGLKRKKHVRAQEIKKGWILVVLSNLFVVLLKLIKKIWTLNLITWALDYCF